MKMHLENWILAHLHDPGSDSGLSFVRQSKRQQNKQAAPALRDDLSGDNETSVTRGPAIMKAGRWQSMDLQPQAEVSYKKDERTISWISLQSYEDLPLTLNAAQIACALGISKSCAYTLLHRDDFPTVRIGRRMLVSKTKFETWLESQDSESLQVCV